VLKIGVGFEVANEGRDFDFGNVWDAVFDVEARGTVVVFISVHWRINAAKRPDMGQVAAYLISFDSLGVGE